jgi:hypothetical protein
MIDHVEIQVLDFAKAAPFWDWLLSNCLGWKAVYVSDDRREWEAKVSESYVVLKAGEANLAPEHIALAAPSLGALANLWNQLPGHGAIRLFEDEHPHAEDDEHHAAYFLDPLGIKMEVVWAPAPDPIVERLTLVNDEQLVQRWYGLLVSMRDELRRLSEERRAFEAFTMQVVNKNPRLLEHPGIRIFQMMRTWYAHAMALAYRRQDDTDSRTASMRVVLDEMLARPSAYRLETIKPLAGGVATDQVIREDVMAPVVDANGNLNQELIRQHRTELKAVGKNVRDFVNNFVAHTNAEAQDRPEGAGVTFNEMFAAHKECERIAEVWLKAFGVYRYPLDPEQEIDWLDVFDFPWRLRRPTDEPDSRKYLFTVDPCLDAAETEAHFASYGGTTPEKKLQLHLEDIGRLADAIRALTLDDRHATWPVPPNVITVERLV